MYSVSCELLVVMSERLKNIYESVLKGKRNLDNRDAKRC